MNIKKMSGSLVAATLMLGLSGQAMAEDCGAYVDLADEIQCHAGNLTCDITYIDGEFESLSWIDVDGIKEWNAPIWQHKGKVGENGCTVHSSLVKQLYTPHDSPPKGRGKSKAVAKGAANDLRDGKLDSAIQHLCNFIETIVYNARTNEVDTFIGTKAFSLAMGQAHAARDWLMYDLAVDPAVVCDSTK